MARQTIQNANASLYFNGSAYADTSSNSTLALANGFTVAGWIKVSKFITASTRQKMIATPNWGFGATSTTQKLSFTTVGVKDYDSTGSSLQPGRWYFACGVLDSSNDVTFYLNGVLDSVVTGTNPATTTAGVTSIGRRPLPTDLHIGNLSGVRVFNRELTATEILNLYNGTVPSGVIAEYLLTEGAGSIAYDTSGNGNHGIITAGTYTADVPTKKREVVGGNMVKNGDFEYAPPFVAAQTDEFKYIDGTATGSTNRLFGWAIFSRVVGSSAQFDNTVKHSGSNSLKLSTTDASGYISVGTFASVATPLATSFRSQLIPVQPSTSYTASVYMKTNNAAANSVWVDFREVNGGLTLGTSNLTTKLAGTNEWGKYTVTFTTADTCRYITPLLKIGVAGNISDAWFDDIQLYPTTPITRTAATGRSVATGRSLA